MRLFCISMMMMLTMNTNDLLADEKYEQDRKAILSMAGAYKVKFSFRETLALQPGYKMHAPHESQAGEWVEVVADQPGFISLQHLLVDDGHVVKHWRQDWTYQNRRLHEYQGGSLWKMRELSEAEAAGTWTQSVYHVDDSPRYTGFGKWTHDGQLVSWESNWTWRPLPRREYTTRSDYDVIIARNRHTLSAGGWVHEQDNHKLVLATKDKPRTILARESGVNTYARSEKADLQPAIDYWRENASFWAIVRGQWSQTLLKHASVEISPANAQDKSLYRAMFSLCKQSQEKATDAGEREKSVKELLAKYVKTGGDNRAAR